MAAQLLVSRPTQIRVGIVGLGDIARVHANAIGANLRLRLVGGVDLDPDKRAAFAIEFDVSTYDTLDQLLGEIDVLLVCVPNAYHSEYTVLGLRAGLLVLCEKPPAMNAHEAREMARAAEEALPLLRRRFPSATGNLLFGLVYRHTLVRELPFLTPSELGQVPFVIATWERDRGVPGRGLFTNLAASGGGAGTDLGVHIRDFAWWILGSPRPLWVGAMTSKELAQTTAVKGYGEYDSAAFEVEDCMVGVALFATGTMLVEWSAFASNVPGGVKEDPNVVFRGSKSGVKLHLHTGDRDPRDMLPEIAVERFGVLQDVRNRTPLPLTVQQGYVRQINHVADVLSGGVNPIVTPDESVVLMAWSDALYRSARELRPQFLGSKDE